MGTPVFVVGHRGMLGHVVARVLAEEGYDVLTADARFEGGARDPLVEAARESGAPFVVNCLGRIWQKSMERDALYGANALFPLQLAQRLHPAQHLFHASTDCVFRGTRGRYAVTDEPDADDDYGVSKLLGEGVRHWPNATVLRVSIVGPDLGGGHGLLGWFLRQPEDRPLNGFANHFWNGITTLEWARVLVERMRALASGAARVPLSQPGTQPVDKYTLLTCFRDAFGTRHEIRRVDAPERVDRTLVPTEPRAPIAEQLAELARWYAAGPAKPARPPEPAGAAR